MATTGSMVNLIYVEDMVIQKQNVGIIRKIYRTTTTMRTVMRTQITLQNEKNYSTYH